MPITISSLKKEFQAAFGGDGVHALLPLGFGQVAIVKRRRNKVLVRVVDERDILPSPKGAGGAESDSVQP